MHFKLITPNSVLFDDDIDMAIIPGAKGEFGVLKDHEPMITKVIKGSLRLYRNDKVIETFSLQEGFAEISPEGCKVLAILSPVA